MRPATIHMERLRRRIKLLILSRHYYLNQSQIQLWRSFYFLEVAAIPVTAIAYDSFVQYLTHLQYPVNIPQKLMLLTEFREKNLRSQQNFWGNYVAAVDC